MTTAAITTPTRQEVLPPLKLTTTTVTLDDLCKVAQVEIDAMSFKELNDFVHLGVNCIALNQASIIRARQVMKPALTRIHEMCAGQGKRNDLAGGITWKTYCANLYMLGCKRTLDELVKTAGLPNPTKQPKLLKGQKVILLADGTDRPISHAAEVTHVHEKTNPNDDIKVEVTYQTPDGAKTETVRTAEVQKVKEKIVYLNTGDLVVLLDIEGGAECRYDGGKKLTRTNTPSKAGAARLAQDEKDVASARRKREAAAAKKEAAAKAKANKREAAVAKKEKAMEDKRLIAAAKKEAAALQAKKKANRKRGHKAATKTIRPFIAQKLGDKFFVFEKGEVETSIRTAKSSQFDTLADAVVCANGLNQKYGFEATI